MGTIVAGLATSHAFTFMNPIDWDGFREKNRESFRRRRGIDAPIHPKIADETVDDNHGRYESIRVAHAALREQLHETAPDALIVIGDDQNEVFVNGIIPQLAVYRGGDFTLSRRFTTGETTYRSHPPMSEAILESGIAAGFDIAIMDTLPDAVLESHAHAQVLEALMPEAEIPIVPLYVNAVHYPALAPRRCYELGQLIGRVIDSRPEGEKIAICASGGLSHFTAGYPWDHYNGPFSYGAISEDFDRDALAAMERGEGDKLADLSGSELLTHGDIELRTWIVLLGALGATRPRFVVYEPFYRAIMGMAVVSWPSVTS